MRLAFGCLLVVFCAAVGGGLTGAAGVPHASAAAAATAAPLKVVLLGDSYAAGNGGDSYWGPKDCWRSSRNWAERYLDTLRSTRNVTFINRACSGGVTADLTTRRRMEDKHVSVDVPGNVSKDDPAARQALDDQGSCRTKYVGDESYDDIYPESAIFFGSFTVVQFHCTRWMEPQWNAVGKDTDLVLLSDGGNDVHFAEIIKQCFLLGLRDTKHCRESVLAGQDDIGGVGTRIGTFLTQLRARMRPDAKIVLVPYPYLEKNPNYVLRNFRPWPFYDSFAVGREVRKLGDLGDTAQHDAVNAANNAPVPGAGALFLETVKPHFAGHEPDGRWRVTNPVGWINEFNSVTYKEWYHYNHTGHQEIANLLAQLDAPGGGTPSGQGSVDITFVIDTTGSMGSAIASVKAAAVSLVNDVSVRTASARFALVDYRDFPQWTGTPADYPSKLDQDFTSSASTINTAINGLVLGDGGDYPETMYSGIKRALDLNWRPGVKKMVIVLADAPALSPEPFTGLTGADIVAQALSIDPAEVHFVDVGGATSNAEAQDIATRTNGGIYRTTPSQAAAQIAAAIDTSLDRPYAWAGGPYTGTLGTTFTLDGRGSYGISAPIVRYQWDVNGDGTYDIDGASPTATYAYTQPFDGFLTLRVTDADGRVGLSTAPAHASLDGDEVPAAEDNCPDVSNPGQDDYDGDGIGDQCDPTTGYPTQDQEGVVDGLGSATSVVAGGEFHSLAALADGSVRAWGGNDKGQLGAVNKPSSATPVVVAGLSGVISVAAGDKFSLALRSDGTVWAWGDGSHGQIGDGTKTSSVVSPKQVAGLPAIISIAAGYDHSLALAADGTVWAWGANGSGQVGGTPADQTRPTQVSGLSGIVAVAGGGTHSVALRGDGAVFGWGADGSGQLGDGRRTTKQPTPVQAQGPGGVVAIAAGFQHTLAVTADGAVWAWGDNGNGEIGDGTRIDRVVPVRIDAAGTARSVAAGRDHSVALGIDGTARAWGSNDKGQLGDGTTTNRLVPVPVAGLSTATAVGAGWRHVLAVLADGTDRSWGHNDKGQLGDGTTTRRTSPVPVAGITANAQPG